MALSGTMLAVRAYAEQTTALDLGTARAPHSLARSLSLGAGTGAGKADRVFSDTRTLAASGTEDLDLVGTALLDAFGAAVTFARVKGLVIAAAAANTNNVVVGAASSNPWATLLSATGTVTLRPGAFLAVGTGVADAIGYATTATTGDLLKIANSSSGTSVTYDIHIIGTVA